MIKEIPMLYSTPMVIAIDNETKGMTRRAKGFGEVNENPDRFVYIGNSNHMEVPRVAVKYDRSTYYMFNLTNSNGSSWVFKCPYGEVGDHIWVRETHYRYGRWSKVWNEKKKKFKHVFFPDPLFKEAMYHNDPPLVIEKERVQSPGWYKRPSIHMPKDVARTWLKITDIKVERLQDISEEDARDEGIIKEWDGTAYWYKNYLTGFPSMFKQKPVLSFKSLWESINGTESWDANPWVWVVKFKKVNK